MSCNHFNYMLELTNKMLSTVAGSRAMRRAVMVQPCSRTENSFASCAWCRNNQQMSCQSSLLRQFAGLRLPPSKQTSRCLIHRCSTSMYRFDCASMPPVYGSKTTLWFIYILMGVALFWFLQRYKIAELNTLSLTDRNTWKVANAFSEPMHLRL